MVNKMKNLKDIVVCVYIDDDENILEVMGSILKRKLKHIYTAKNGKEGLELIRKIKPDIIITDINMPIMDGLEMIKTVRGFGNGFTDIPIIAVTAYRDEEYFTELADIYFYKPIKVKELLVKIEELVNKD